MSRLVMFGALFVALTVAGVLWALSRAPVRAGDLYDVFARQSAAPLTVIAIACLAIYATDVLRYRSLGRAIGTHVDWKAGLDSSVANFLFSWVFPGSTFGAPATIYMLGRRGVPWDAAVVIAFGKAFTGVAVVVLASLAFVSAGFGPTYDRALLVTLVGGGSVFSALFGLLVLAAFRPEPARRIIAGVYGRLAGRFGRGHVLTAFERVTTQSVDRLVQLRRGGAWPLVDLAVTHVLYFVAFGALGVALMHAFGAAVGVRPFAAVVVYLMFTYLAPTPGGAGFAEAMAIPFFGPLLAAADAVMFVLCFRGLTLYLQVGVGVPYLLFAGGMREIVTRAARRE
ncbi:MAG TPA: lysylphosphatidylglycerol synthase transmembrane domain-containing protein [Polyangia bacterium]|nr:lysylphosphatidylglycerol synthase transmembrane domain-containing protein [Polyangia bacterium]